MEQDIKEPWDSEERNNSKKSGKGAEKYLK